MSELRQQMIDAMRQRGYSVRTHQAYLAAVEDLGRFYRRSPARLSVEEVKGYFRELAVRRGLSASTCRQHFHAARFFYHQVLERPGFEFSVALPKRRERIPELLTRAEVARLLGVCYNLKHRTALATCYGCGLRVSELLALRVRDIDGERQLLRVEQGKGGKDRLVPIGTALLHALRAYWRHFRPALWLFPHGNHPEQALSITTYQKVFQCAKARAGIEKVGGIHSLRHAYATHQLEAGLPVRQFQRLLDHQSIKSTLRSVHWRPNDPETPGPRDLLGALAQMPEREVCHG